MEHETILPLDRPTEYSHELQSILRCVMQNREADALLLSGGIDSSVLAALDPKPLAITVGFGEQSEDVKAAQKVAQHLGLRWHCIIADIHMMRDAAKEIIERTQTYNPGLFHDIPLYLGMKHAAEYGYRKIRTGEIADMLFGGYSSSWHLSDYAQGLRQALS